MKKKSARSALNSHFTQVLNDHIHAGDRLLVALSGGLDSRVLLHLAAGFAKQAEMPILAVHVHHGLSPNADHWAQACQHWCAELAIPCHVERVSLPSTGESLEQLARDARYQALQHYVDAKTVLLTGQHSDDQLETFFLALKRGSGPKGLSSMAAISPFAQGRLLRPLLTVSRVAITQFAEEQKLTWVEDESNQNTRFDRNFLRLDVLPILTARWPSLADAVARSAQLCAEQEQILDELLVDKYRASCYEDGSLMIAPLMNQSQGVRMRLLRMWFAEQQARMPSLQQLETLWHEVACAQMDANPSLRINTVQVRRFHQRLHLVPEGQDVTAWQQTLYCDAPLTLPDGLGQLVLNTCIGNGHLRLPKPNESWQVVFDPQGRSAHPHTRGHRRKLKKLFQEYQVPSWQRRRMPIIICEEQVVAVADLFIDRSFTGEACELIWHK